MIDFCLRLMKHFYFEYWTEMPAPQETGDDSSLMLLHNEKLNNNGLMRFSTESKYYEELGPYFLQEVFETL